MPSHPLILRKKDAEVINDIISECVRGEGFVMTEKTSVDNELITQGECVYVGDQWEGEEG